MSATGNKNAQRSDEGATSFMHIRLTPSQKASYVKAAQREGKKLTEWVIESLDRQSS